jgi:uncharacterized repeat protein (TIGR01451 family)
MLCANWVSVSKKTIISGGWDDVLAFLNCHRNTSTRYPLSGGIRYFRVFPTLFFIFLVLATSVNAEVRRSFSTRFETNTTGDIFLIGNTSLTADPSDPDATNTQNGVGTRLNNNNFNMVNVDVDVDGTTFNSSSADFTVPPGSEVLWAGLYWGADTGNATALNPPDISRRNQVLLSMGGGYQTIFSDIPLDEDAPGSRYQGFSNVTSQIQLHTAGSTRTYSVANIQAVTGIGPSHYAGWALVIVLRDPAESLRHLHVFDGFAVVAGTDTVNTNVSGFLTPPSGTFATHIGMVAYEGDLGTLGDFFQVNGNTIADTLNPANNLFNCSITRLDSAITDKSPNYVNQLGFDIDTLDVPYSSGIIANGATSANLTFSTNGDWYYPGVLTFGTDIYQPIIEGNVIKTMTDLNGGALNPGDVIAYTIAVRNTGDDNAVDVVLQDSIPAFTSYVSNSLEVVSGANAGFKSDATGDDQAEYQAGNNRVVFRLGTGADGANGGDLAYNESTVARFQVQVDTTIPSGATIENTAIVDYVAFTTNEAITASSNTMSSVYLGNADLFLEKRVDVTTPDEGETLTYTIEVINNGPYDGTNIIVEDPLPAGVTYVSDLASQGGYDSGTGIWTVGDLANGAGATLSVSVTVDTGTTGATITNTAMVTAVEPTDLDVTDNSDSIDIVIGGSDLEVTKTVDTATPNEGESVVFTVTVTNIGGNDATNIAVTDLLPAGVTYVSDTPVQGSYDNLTGVWTVGNLANGAGATLTISAIVDAGAGGTTITNIAAVTAVDQGDPGPSNNSASVDLVPGLADLGVSKTVNNPTPNERSTITYTVAVTNNGPTDATNVMLIDLLPVGVSYISSTRSQGLYDNTTGLWAMGDLAVGAGATLTITATVDTGAGGATIINIADGLSADQTDPNPANNQDSVNVTVQTSLPPNTPQLDINKASDAGGIVTPGDTITYTINVTNTGNVPLSGIRVSDALPAGTAYITDSTQVTAPTSSIETVRDEFNTVSFAGNNGTRNWRNDWQELGESDGPGTGNVEADTTPAALEIGGGFRVNINGDGASRAVDLSGAVSAILSLDVWRFGTTNRSVTLAVWDDATGSWVNLKTYINRAPTPTVQTTETFDLTPYMSANTQIRFLGSGRSARTSYLYFDNVEIAYTVSGPPTTTPGGAPPNLANGYFLGTGEQMRVTFQVTANTPFDDPDGTVDNLAAADSDQTGSQNSNVVVDRVLVPVPDIVLLKSVQTFSDPYNGEIRPKAIPGAVMLYTIAATNQGNGAADSDSVVITDAIPVNTSLYVGDLDGGGSPVQFIDGTPTSGLTYTFIGLASIGDDIEFSDDNGLSFDYTPIPGVDDVDVNVTHIRMRPKGTFRAMGGGAAPGFELKFRVKLE